MTRQSPWQINQGDAVTRWELTPIVEQPFPGESRPMPDIVDYLFRNGFTDVGDLPCREAFRKTMLGRHIDVAQTGFGEIHLASDSDALDFSEFWHEPTHVSRFARCVLIASETTNYRFRLSTCGCARIWVNQRLIATFEPFDRNTVQRTHIDLPLLAGENDIVVHMEDLCERDTKWLVELRSEANASLGLRLSVPIDTTALLDIERCLGTLRLDKPYYRDEPVYLIVDNPPATPINLDVIFFGMHRSDDESFGASVLLKSDVTRVRLCEANQAGEGCRAISLTAAHQGISISRTIGGTFVANIRRGEGGNISERKREALAYYAETGKTDPARALANLKLDRNLHQAERLLVQAVDRINRREDCSDFAMVPLLWAWQHFANTGLDNALRQKLRAAILGWRYWLDEPGNDVMWFWSENHALCFHVSQYLAGQNFPDDVFTTSGRTGDEQKEFAHARLIRWFESIEQHGLAEWNSSAYYPIDFIGLFGLMELAEDADLRERSKRLIDMIFVTVALHTQNGILGGTMGRAYEKELLAGPAAELSGFAYVAWGSGWIAQACASLPMFCLSDYEPPAITNELVFPKPGQPIEASYSQGVDHAGRLRLWKDKGAQLSTIVDHQTGEPGHQQHVVDVLLAGNPFARFWVNHPGDSHAWSHHRPSYWAGNGRLPHVAQYSPVALLTFQSRGNDELPWTHLLAPRRACDAVVETGRWLFVRSGDGFAGFCATEGMSQAEDGLFVGDEWRSYGMETAWVIVVGSGDDAAFKTFQDRWLAAQITFDKPTLRLVVHAIDMPSLVLDRGGGLSVDGVPMPFAPLAVTPHVSLDGGALRPWMEL